MEGMCNFSSKYHSHQSCTTHITAPSEPIGLEVVTTSGSSVTLRWKPPTVLGDTSVNYIIGYFGASTLFTTTNTIFEVTGLSSSTMFNFSVKANNSVGTSAPVHIVAMTTDGMCVQYECICAHLYYDIICLCRMYIFKTIMS